MYGPQVGKDMNLDTCGRWPHSKVGSVIVITFGWCESQAQGGEVTGPHLLVGLLADCAISRLCST